MLTIRLQRTGKRNQADFRIVLAEKTAPVNKKIVEVLGSYNPRKKMFRVKSEDRLKHWLDQKVAVSPTMHNLFVTNKVLEGGKVKAFSIPKKVEEKKEDKAGAPASTPSEAGAGAENQPAPAAAEPAAAKEEVKSADAPVA